MTFRKLINVYSAPTSNKVKTISLVSFGQVGIWGLMRGLETWIPVETQVSDSLIANPIWWDVGFVASIMMAGFGVGFAKRSVSSIGFMKNAKRLHFKTYSVFGTPCKKEIVVPLQSVKTTSVHSQAYLPVYVEGYKGFFLVDPSGIIHDQKLFSKWIGKFK